MNKPKYIEDKYVEIFDHISKNTARVINVICKLRNKYRFKIRILKIRQMFFDLGK